MKTPVITRKRTASFRKKVDTETDSYLAKGAPGKMVVCHGCHALSVGRRWYQDEEAYAKLLKTETVREVFCPACEKIRDGYPSGQVVLKGPFLAEHRDEILHIITNEEKRARGLNPLHRIMSLREENEQLEITTTDEKLAQRIGRELHKACGGTVAYGWSHNNKYLRVQWER
ncbi:BCAM0308 family protein [Candidatus Methylomirabilis sp.]|uniref:ATPase n=1 Tax=Candidatus Methylomirabilis tolerans TaxID=3123416 RepID=A0AAJ1EU63_9BACT|nr:ATPase [Candidatus Methylomirabilis sp.]